MSDRLSDFTPESVPESAADPETIAANAAPTLRDLVTLAVGTVTGNPLARLDFDMKHVLDALAALDPKPIEKCGAVEARLQPGPADAVKALLRQQGHDDAPDPAVAAYDLTYPGAAGDLLPLRVYRPANAGAATLPVILYFHGGGFVIADLDAYDAAPRAMSRLVHAVVVSAHYRQAPEHSFPAAHDDAVAAYTWLLANAENFGGDPTRLAVMGESAGGNLAIHVAITARDRGLPAPLHQALIYPLAGIDIDSPSYRENANAKPLNKEMMKWFFAHLVQSPADQYDPRLDLIGHGNLAGLPPTTVVTAQVDPLRCDGERLTGHLNNVGVTVTFQNYPGVTHEFFGMAALVQKAKEAQEMVAGELRAALGGPAEGVEIPR